MNVIVKEKKQAFDPVNLLLELHQNAGGLRVKMTVEAKRRITTRFARLKDDWNMDRDELMMMIAFMYCHDPLDYRDLTRYGDLSCLNSVAAKWKRWWNANRHHVKDPRDFIPVLRESAPDQMTKDIDQAIESALDGIYGI